MADKNDWLGSLLDEHDRTTGRAVNVKRVLTEEEVRRLKGMLRKWVEVRAIIHDAAFEVHKQLRTRGYVTILTEDTAKDEHTGETYTSSIDLKLSASEVKGTTELERNAAARRLLEEEASQISFLFEKSTVVKIRMHLLGGKELLDSKSINLANVDKVNQGHVAAALQFFMRKVFEVKQ